jgi:DNA-binding IclR family transcriptional regulator
VLLAFQTAQRRAEMWASHEAMDGEAPMAAAQLDQTLEAVRTQGYWQGDSLQSFGVIDISMPVIGPGGSALGVLTCPYIRRIDRHVAPDIDATRELLQVQARNLSLA